MKMIPFTMIEISVNGLKKSFEIGNNILDGITFQIETGERVGLLGRNGAGKSTLFKLLTGELDADEGDVVIAKNSRVGLISQIPVYPQGYTVDDVLHTAFARHRKLAEEMEKLAAAMAAGETWFKVPSAIRVNLTGKLQPHVSGKDVILTLIGRIGVDGARYQSLEFTGPGVRELTIYDRLTISNMAIEAGAKNGIFPVDDITRAYVAGRVDRPWEAVEADGDAEYERTVEIDLDQVDCTVAWPHLPENARSAREGKDIAIDQIVIGSCTNGQLPDMAAAAEILKGRRLAPGVRGIVIPATQSVYRECMHLGYTDVFLDAGCIVSTPTCGPCLGGYMGILAAGERCVSTTNRNFVGRMGHVDSEVYLASPAVAAASGIAGHIAHPEEVLK